MKDLYKNLDVVMFCEEYLRLKLNTWQKNILRMIHNANITGEKLLYLPARHSGRYYLLDTYNKALIEYEKILREKYKNMKPLIRKNICTGQMIAGFLESENGVFHTVREIHNEDEIDKFMKYFDINILYISRCEN